MPYDRLKSVEYAKEWWNKRNPLFYNFDRIGGDCTNFISQCLYYGGISMNFDKYGWYYNSVSNRAPSWTGVDEFYSFLITNRSKYGAKAREVEMEELQIGDVVQLDQRGESFNHTLLITEIMNYPTIDNIYIACHSADAFNKRLSEFVYKRIRFLKIENS